MSTITIEPPAQIAPAPEAPVEEQPVQGRKPRLSEVIRVGVRHHPQGRSRLYHTGTGGTCALGAALVGLFGPQWTKTDPHRFNKMGLRELLLHHTGVDLNQWERNPAVECPPHLGYQTLGTVIVQLNDGDRWSRERIADWLETLGL